SIRAALALPLSAARRSNSRAEAKSPLFSKFSARLTSIATLSLSIRVAANDRGPETGAVAAPPGGDGDCCAVDSALATLAVCDGGPEPGAVPVGATRGGGDCGVEIDVIVGAPLTTSAGFDCDPETDAIPVAAAARGGCDRGVGIGAVPS